MTSDQFCYWLQGFFELTGSNQLSEKQVRMIKEHLQLVFTKVTTESLSDTAPEDQTLCADIAARDEAQSTEITFKGKSLSELTDDELLEAEQRITRAYPNPLESMIYNDYTLLRAVAEEKLRRRKLDDVPAAIRGLKAEFDALLPEEKAKRNEEMQAKWESHKAKPKQPANPRYSNPWYSRDRKIC